MRLKNNIDIGYVQIAPGTTGQELIYMEQIRHTGTGLPETHSHRQDSSAACYAIVFFQGRNLQLAEEAGRGAAGPVISHS